MIGYTLKALGAGFWALSQAESFAEGVSRIVHEGGDGDSSRYDDGAALQGSEPDGWRAFRLHVGRRAAARRLKVAALAADSVTTRSAAQFGA